MRTMERPGVESLWCFAYDTGAYGIVDSVDSGDVVDDTEKYFVWSVGLGGFSGEEHGK